MKTQLNQTPENGSGDSRIKSVIAVRAAKTATVDVKRERDSFSCGDIQL
jgi:predicted RecA/RadA family phage recombinase